MKWPMVKLGDICRLINGRAYKKHEMLTEGKYPLMRVGNFFSNREWYYSDLELPDKQYCDNGDLIYAWSASFGPQIWQGGKVIYHYHIWKLVVDEGLADKNYLFYALKRDVEFIKAEQGSGSTMVHVTKTAMESREIPLPPLEEQKRIAAILDKADAIRRKRQQAIELADEFLRSVFLDMFGDPVTNPKGWEVRPLGDFCRFQGGFAFKSADFTVSGVPLVKITNVHFENVDWSDVSYLPEKILIEKPDFSLRSGDLVMAMTRPIIKSLNAVKVVEIKDNDTPSLLNQRVGRFIGYEQSASKCFLKYFLYSEYFKSEVDKLCSVALQPNVSAKQIESIACYLPPRLLQDDFSRIVIVVTEALSKMNVASNEKLFESLSHRAFSGQL